MKKPLLSTLLRLQWFFAALSSGYLIVSALRQSLTGEPLSAANIPASLAMFALYALCLLLPHFGRIAAYRIAMLPALLLFGGGGVAGNIVRFAESGLENYAGTIAFVVAVLINLFGTLLNIAAALRWFRKDLGITSSKEIS